MGFSSDFTVEKPTKFILALAPHTSNWDFIIGLLYSYSEDFHCNFLIKKEWFFWPMGVLFRSMGGIPVERNRHVSLTDRVAEAAMKADRFELAVTPEGTRSLATKWKRGFYFIALKAGLPIQLYAIDYKNKRIVCTKELVPSGDVEADMRLIMDYYRPYEGKYPGKFAVEDI